MTNKKIEIDAAANENPATNLEARVSSLEAKFEVFMGEMRDRDNQRAEDMREIRSKLDNIGNHTRNLAVAAIVGIGAISISVIGFVISVVSK